VPASPEITHLLAAWTEGDRAALDALMPVVMEELKRIAAAYLAREAHARTLQTTALVNEAYLRLVNVRAHTWESRAQFFALAARIMRRILIDHARTQLGPQRGGRLEHVPLDTALAVSTDAPHALVALDEAMLGLEKRDARKSRIVELRLFGGLSNDEIAQALDISERTVIREWQFAKAWLARELSYALPDSD
jgi:RNA polymerase sigma-70 factor, ECF subfamily